MIVRSYTNDEYNAMAFVFAKHTIKTCFCLRAVVERDDAVEWSQCVSVIHGIAQTVRHVIVTTNCTIKRVTSVERVQPKVAGDGRLRATVLPTQPVSEGDLIVIKYNIMSREGFIPMPTFCTQSTPTYNCSRD